MSEPVVSVAASLTPFVFEVPCTLQASFSDGYGSDEAADDPAHHDAVEAHGALHDVEEVEERDARHLSLPEQVPRGHPVLELAPAAPLQEIPELPLQAILQDTDLSDRAGQSDQVSAAARLDIAGYVKIALDALLWSRPV